MTMPSCTAEGGDVLPRQHAAEPYSRAVDAAIRRVQVGADPRRAVRATRRKARYRPRLGHLGVQRMGREFGPSTSWWRIGAQLSSR